MTESNMLKGSLFEYWATGGTSSPIVPKMADNWIKSHNNKIGKFKNETIEKIWNAAQSAKTIFKDITYANSEFFVDIDENNELTFHPDVIGVVKLPDYENEFMAIVDTKYTGSINEIWNTKDNKQDFLQALVYIYGFYKWTEKESGKGIHLPFVYQITEHNAFSKPLHKYILINANEANFKEFEQLLKNIINDTEFKAKANDYNCLGKGGQMGACRYMDFCEEGRKLINKTEVFEYSNLS